MFKMYVVSHKKVNLNLPKNYSWIQVNAAKNPKFTEIIDSNGDNISLKNPNFCELTALYWIWKNDKESEIVGISHYRRFFSKSHIFKSPKFFINESDATKILNKYDIIASNLYDAKKSVYDHCLESCFKKDLDNLRLSINEVAKDYLDAYDTVMNGRTSYLLNMMVIKKTGFDNYCKWLFEILFALEKKTDLTGYDTYHARLYGFLSERLLTVYLMKNNLKVYSMHVNNIEESLIHKIKGKLSK